MESVASNGVGTLTAYGELANHLVHRDSTIPGALQAFHRAKSC